MGPVRSREPFALSASTISGTGCPTLKPRWVHRVGSRVSDHDLLCIDGGFFALWSVELVALTAMQFHGQVRFPAGRFPPAYGLVGESSGVALRGSRRADRSRVDAIRIGYLADLLICGVMYFAASTPEQFSN